MTFAQFQGEVRLHVISVAIIKQIPAEANKINHSTYQGLNDASSEGGWDITVNWVG